MPEPEKKKKLWLGVGVSLIVIIPIWLLTFSGTNEPTPAGQNNSSWQQIKEEWQQFTNRFSDLKTALGEEQSVEATTVESTVMIPDYTEEELTEIKKLEEDIFPQKTNAQENNQ